MIINIKFGKVLKIELNDYFLVLKINENKEGRKMIKEEKERIKAKALEYFQRAGIVIFLQEKESMEIADLGLMISKEQGLS